MEFGGREGAMGAEGRRGGKEEGCGGKKVRAYIGTCMCICMYMSVYTYRCTCYMYTYTCKMYM